MRTSETEKVAAFTHIVVAHDAGATMVTDKQVEHALMLLTSLCAAIIQSKTTSEIPLCLSLSFCTLRQSAANRRRTNPKPSRSTRTSDRGTRIQQTPGGSHLQLRVLVHGIDRKEHNPVVLEACEAERSASSRPRFRQARLDLHRSEKARM